jgi:nucleotidyltransferase substrate binding protein (TIGR01987 family)
MVNLFTKKFQDAIRALATLEEALNTDYTIFVRDSAIQRFEYTTEAFWKCLQMYLKEIEGIVVSSPKSAIREVKKNGIINDVETETALEMIDDRNLTAHTYHEEIAQKLFKNLPEYSKLMKNILERVKNIGNVGLKIL